MPYAQSGQWGLLKVLPSEDQRIFPLTAAWVIGKASGVRAGRGQGVSHLHLHAVVSRGGAGLPAPPWECSAGPHHQQGESYEALPPVIFRGMVTPLSYNILPDDLR